MLAVVWLGMVLQPCLMAAEMPANMDDCPHCPMPMPEDSGAGACTYVDHVDYDGRTPHTKLVNEQADDHVVFLAAATDFQLPKHACGTGPPTAALDLPTPPLNVLFCVYLI